MRFPSITAVKQNAAFYLLIGVPVVAGAVYLWHLQTPNPRVRTPVFINRTSLLPHRFAGPCMNCHRIQEVGPEAALHRIAAEIPEAEACKDGVKQRAEQAPALGEAEYHQDQVHERAHEVADRHDEPGPRAQLHEREGRQDGEERDRGAQDHPQGRGARDLDLLGVVRRRQLGLGLVGSGVGRREADDEYHERLDEEQDAVEDHTGGDFGVLAHGWRTS